ncbi:MAG: type II toxin-antitoxin system RelB/DinJ family antitoxin [Synergistaceae bacterium]|nr:type II toxin-antitoxin system RelB/DinJ family antitoxin [Synergistaceae bacterium]
MATSTIRLDDGVREETTRIAAKMGLSFNAVINIMARKFNAEQGFPFPVRLETAEKTVFDLSSDEFEQTCRWAVAEREAVPAMEYVTRLDQETGAEAAVERSYNSIAINPDRIECDSYQSGFPESELAGREYMSQYDWAVFGENM